MFDVCLCVAGQLGAFDAVVKQMLEDVQERLVYRTHIYIQTDILGYNPAPGDLAYPEKLEMMEVLQVFQGCLQVSVVREARPCLHSDPFLTFSTFLDRK